jgi:neutral ceramidase
MPLQEGYGQLYTQENVVISGIHTHSGPAGYLQYLLYDIPARGFVHETFNVLVNGIAAVRLPPVCP